MLPSRPTLRHHCSPSRTRQLIPRAQPHPQETARPPQASSNGRIPKHKRWMNSWTQRKSSNSGEQNNDNHHDINYTPGPIHHQARAEVLSNFRPRTESITARAPSEAIQFAQAIRSVSSSREWKRRPYTSLLLPTTIMFNTSVFPRSKKPYHICWIPNLILDFCDPEKEKEKKY